LGKVWVWGLVWLPQLVSALAWVMVMVLGLVEVEVEVVGVRL
jgi:hypothetical protein